MNAFKTTLICACLAIATTGVMAQDAMKKDDMAKKPMTMQECKDHMAMSKKDGMKKDDAMMAKDHACDDMMKKDGMMKKDDGMMKKDGAASAPMAK